MQNYFRLLNEYYDKIYVLTIAPATERREKFAARFRGLQYSFFMGIEKKDIDEEKLISEGVYSKELSQKNHRYNKSKMPGELACSLGHKMIYEDMLKNNYSRALIFEDDAVPDADILLHTAAVLDEVPADSELLYWGWAKNGKKTGTAPFKQALYIAAYYLGLMKWSPLIIRNLYAADFSAHLKKAGFHDYTYAYGITKSGAEKLLQMQTPIQFIADNLLAHACTKEIVNGYIVDPPAFLHDSLPDGRARDSYIR